MEVQDFAPQHVLSQLEFTHPATWVVDRRGETAKKMIEFLELSTFSLHPTAAEVTSEDNRDQFRIGIAQIYASLTNFDDFSEAEARTHAFFEMALDHLKPAVKSINVRTADIAPAESFEGLRDQLNEKLVTDIGGIKEAIGVPLSDTAWVFEFENSDCSGRVQFGPMESKQLGEVLGGREGMDDPPNFLFLATEAKFPFKDTGDRARVVEGWKKALARQRAIAQRTGDWVKAKVA